ncbi:pentatricopeptide repeat domain-containing protein [Beauveria bassiana ARSEF 2860]|uniref:Pentatricopeptide repeat domain-containing protein n=1 Tax=Beauveria bassiana (strain ARSEF 2860) TaxID=655819 RepID=J4UJC8_BEAB2|nr:pentatricopeptide repeat domain-containing protein [Beauveria bassiana ARSEF 2860]EJP63917.1 pentatricopeptide repeat domain-containing protein [Beauveria bassiana ARSEF 2860]
MATYPECDATKRKKLPLSTTEAVDTAELEATYGGVIDWTKVIICMDSTYGAQGVFAVMERLRERESLDVVMPSDLIRNAFVNAGIQLSSKRQLLFACADDLLQRFDYRWPNLYTRCMHFLLEKESFEEAAETHAYLAPSFLPDRHVLGLLFENFVSNPDIRMQKALKGIYLSLPQHDLYDIIIPALFKSGQSKMAKRWRQTFLLSGDFPSSEASGPFLAFLASYYTNTNFTPEERRILDILLEKNSPKRRKNATTIRCIAAPTKSEDALVSSAWRLETSQGSAQPRPEIKSLVDGFVEKLFASSWTPPDLAMQLAKNAGIRSIGPRAFQALALRASSATEVNELIKSLHKLNISIPAGAYCTAISEFAKQGHDSLLSNLLQSDIHPEEFDDEETRQMILEHSIRRRDTKQEDLMRSVISAIDAQTRLSTQSPSLNLATAAPAFTIEKLLFDEPWRMKLALERMVSLNLRIGSIEASAILRRAFAAFPANSRGIVWCSTECIHILDEVIGLARCIAAQDVAIRSEHWKMLLIGLGHQGRLDALAQLSLELVDMYDPSRACLLPVHKVDLPKMTKLATDFLRRTEHSGLIPADLSFYHHHHPLFKIFDGHFQRTVVQLGFTWALNLSEGTASTPVVQNALVRKFDVASGIHILANLRDRGCFIDMDLVESAARNGIYSSQRMRQRDGDSRGRQWFSPMQMKKVADLAWGATLMPASYVIGLNQKDFRALSAPTG